MYIQTKEPGAVSLWAFCILLFCCGQIEGATQQIKMFLTRMGMNTKMIVTGDMTQIDLPASQTSGLVQAIKILKGVKGISFIELNKKDIVRHKLVTRIVEAYEKFEEKEKAERKTTRTAKEPEKTPQA